MNGNIRPVRLVWLVHGQLDSAGLCSLTLSHSDRLPAWQSRLLKGCSEPAWATLNSCRCRQKSSDRSRTISHIYNRERWQQFAGLVQNWHQASFFFFLKVVMCTIKHQHLLYATTLYLRETNITLALIYG